jgi:hypothetical protein
MNVKLALWSTNLIFYFCLSCHVTSDRLVNDRLTQKFWCAYVGSRMVNVDES